MIGRVLRRAARGGGPIRLPGNHRSVLYARFVVPGALAACRRAESSNMSLTRLIAAPRRLSWLFALLPLVAAGLAPEADAAPSGTKSAPAAPPILDADEIAAAVRRDEAIEEARTLGYDEEDEAYGGGGGTGQKFGVAIIGAGIAVAAATSDCVGSDTPTMSTMSSEIDMMAVDGTEPTVCGQYWTDPSGIFGPMIALHGMPLISLPIAYAIRAALRTDAKQTTFNIGTPAGGGVLMQVRGVF